jgi:Putative adhesin
VSAEVADTERAGPKLTKKLFAVGAVIGLILSLAGSTAAHENPNPLSGEKTGVKIDRTMTVDPSAIVTLCVASGTLKVRGWDKNEIHVRSLDAAQIEFRRIDKVKDTRPAGRVDVMVLDKVTGANPKLDCQALASVEMDVPTGATVQVQTRDGDIMIAGVAAAYAGSQNGDIEIERVTKLVEAGSLGGSIYLKDSSGRVNLSSASGVLEVVNVHAATDDDTLEVGTVSGDIQLNRVSNPKVTAKTVNGALSMTGPLAKSGSYGFTNMTGDVILSMPHDASFQLNAKVNEKHDIVSDFALKYLSEPPPPRPAAKPGKPAAEAPKPPEAKGKVLPRTGPVVAPIVVDKPTVIANPYALRRVSAICGTGDATISIASFGGTVRLKKI